MAIFRPDAISCSYDRRRASPAGSVTCSCSGAPSASVTCWRVASKYCSRVTPSGHLLDVDVRVRGEVVLDVGVDRDELHRRAGLRDRLDLVGELRILLADLVQGALVDHLVDVGRLPLLRDADREAAALDLVGGQAVLLAGLLGLGRFGLVVAAAAGDERHQHQQDGEGPRID